MQYRTGTVTVTNGSATVLGSGTAFLANVPVGSVFSVSASGVPYIVGAVPDDTHLTLSSNYAGATLPGQSYACTTSFTTNYKLPYPEAQDIDTATVIKRAMVTIDTMLGAASIGTAAKAGRVVFTDASGNLSTSAALAYDGTVVTIGGTAAPELHLSGNAVGTSRVRHTTNNVLRWLSGVPSGSTDYRWNNGSSDVMTLTAAGNVTVSGTGPHAIGGATLANYQVRQTGTWAGGGTHAHGFALDSTFTPGAGGSSDAMYLGPTINKAGSGTHADFASLFVDPPIIGAGAATLTNSSTVKISGAPSVGTNQRALWVAAGLSQFDGQVKMTASSNVTAALVFNQAAVIQLNNSADNTGGTIKNAGGSGACILTYVPNSGTEAFRVTDAGYFKAAYNGTYISATGAYNELHGTGSNLNILYMQHREATNPFGINIGYTAAAPNDTGHDFITLADTGATRGTWRSNGGIANFSANNVNLSDEMRKLVHGATQDHSQFVEALEFIDYHHADGLSRGMLTGLSAQRVGRMDGGADLITSFDQNGTLGIYEHQVQQRINSVIPGLLREVRELRAAVNDIKIKLAA